MSTNYFKQEIVTPDAAITNGAHKRQTLESVVYSYDQNVSKLIIPVATPKIFELDFEDVETIKVLLTVTQDGVVKKIEDTATIEKVHRRHISYIITDRLNGYQGNVKMNIYLDLKNGQQIDLAEYGFTMVRSAIDQDIPEIEDFYFKSLDDVIVELKQKTEAAWQEVAGDLSEINGSIDAVNEKVNQLDSKADEISDQIANNDFRNFIIGKEIVIDAIANFVSKVAGSDIENPHTLYRDNNGILPTFPFVNLTEETQVAYDRVAKKDDLIRSIKYDSTGDTAKHIAQFDLVSDVERNNPGIFEYFGAITASEKLALIRKLVDGTIRPVAYASGSGASTTSPGTSRSQVNMQIYGTTWHGGAVNTTNKIAMLEYKNQTGQRIQDDGCVYVVLYAPPSDGVAPSVINIDQVYLEYKIKFKMSDVFVIKEDQYTPTLIIAPTAGSEDLNTYIKSGDYLCRTSLYAANVLNTPMNIAFKLEVRELAPYGDSPGVNQLLTTYHTSNTKFKRFSRNLYNNTWSVWREIPFVDQVQMNKVTQDSGDALIKVSDTETILDRVIASGAGFKTGEATGKTADAPTTSNTRLTINMVNATAGVVEATDTGGAKYTRVISGSVWRDEWKRQPTAKEFEDLAAKVTALESKVK